MEATERQARKPKKITPEPKPAEPEKEKSLAELMGLEDDGAKPAKHRNKNRQG